jgi:hypothetical protein
MSVRGKRGVAKWGGDEAAESNDQPNGRQNNILIKKMGFPPTNFKLWSQIKGNTISI